MTDQNLRDYNDSGRDGWIAILREALRRLGTNDPDADGARWMVERAETVAALRRICAAHGDNNWPDDLHLADVVDKHLARHLHYQSTAS